jgi:hypothetical protein
MKHPIIFFSVVIIFFLSCNTKTTEEKTSINLNGTWQLLSAVSITKGDSTFTDYTKNQKMVKIVNDSYFAFLKHDVNVPKDSSLNFDAGGGRYTLNGDKYKEYLDFYNDKKWEGKSFDFTVTLKNDTLTQQGVEKVEGTNVDHIIIEKYVRIKN